MLNIKVKSLHVYVVRQMLNIFCACRMSQITMYTHSKGHISRLHVIDTVAGSNYHLLQHNVYIVT